MGRKIGIPKEEYRMLLNETMCIHQNVSNVVEYYLKELDSLLVPEGGFHADMISEKAKLVLEIFRQQVLPRLEQEYQETEEKLRLFGSRMEEIDQNGEGKAQWHESI